MAIASGGFSLLHYDLVWSIPVLGNDSSKELCSALPVQHAYWSSNMHGWQLPCVMVVLCQMELFLVFIGGYDAKATGKAGEDLSSEEHFIWAQDCRVNWCGSHIH